MDDRNKINELSQRFELLLQKQDHFQKEIKVLQNEIEQLKRQPTESKVEDKIHEIIEPVKDEVIIDEQVETKTQVKEKAIFSSGRKAKIGSNLEEYIGRNVISKVGIIVFVLGIGIGVKYAIDKDLIGPVMRILLGYIAGLGLLGIAIKLKKNYKNFSAGLLSGGMASVYFVTYAAHSYFDLIPPYLTLGLMIVFTVFTVAAAFRYNMQIIAIFGLVGAYVIPFLLGFITDNDKILLSYITIINLGILFTAFHKHWKLLYYIAFGFSWIVLIVFDSFMLNSEKETFLRDNFVTNIIFIIVFFSIFQLAYLFYKLIHKEKFNAGEIIISLSNSFIFFFLGYYVLKAHQTGEEFRGLFTFCIGLSHLISAYVIFRSKLQEKIIFYLSIALALTFITLAVSVQFDGSIVTIVWAAEAAILFWLGRTKGIPFYERVSNFIVVMAFFSLTNDWNTLYGNYSTEAPETRIFFLLNTNFLNSLFVISGLIFINLLNLKKEFISEEGSSQFIKKVMNYALPIILFITIYFSFQVEIKNYWDQLYYDSAITEQNTNDVNILYDRDIWKYKSITGICYSLFFFSFLSFLNLKFYKQKVFSQILLGLNLLFIIIFLAEGLPIFKALRQHYLEQYLGDYYPRGLLHIFIRYISYIFVALIFISNHFLYRQIGKVKYLPLIYSVVFHSFILIILSSELISIMSLMGSTHTYKISLSILWSLYAVFLIVYGLWKKLKHIRIAAIALIGIAIIKLFTYDMSHFSTIAKTIAFISIGTLLLIIAFLYNKYKDIMFADDKVDVNAE